MEGGIRSSKYLSLGWTEITLSTWQGIVIMGCLFVKIFSSTIRRNHPIARFWSLGRWSDVLTRRPSINSYHAWNSTRIAKLKSGTGVLSRPVRRPPFAVRMPNHTESTHVSLMKTKILRSIWSCGWRCHDISYDINTLLRDSCSDIRRFCYRGYVYYRKTDFMSRAPLLSDGVRILTLRDSTYQPIIHSRPSPRLIFLLGYT